jgi:uncharacterized cupredoxin-like copper-binding protein
MLLPNRKRTLHRPLVTASLSVLLLGLAACGSDSKSSSATAAPAAVATTPAAADTTPGATTAAGAETTVSGAGATGTAVAVKESEFKIEIPQMSFTAGTYTFNITNAGQFKHSLVVEGNGTEVKSDTVDAGSTGTLTVPLTAGTYEVYCGIPTHKGKGMDLTITVT